MKTKLANLALAFVLRSTKRNQHSAGAAVIGQSKPATLRVELRTGRREPHWCAMNQLNVSLQHTIATLAANHWSARKIARELGLHRETVGRYLRAASLDSKPAIAPTGSPKIPEPKPAIVPAGSKAGRTSQCAPWADVIRQGLSAGLSAQRLYQDLIAEHGFTGAYDAVKRL